MTTPERHRAILVRYNSILTIVFYDPSRFARAYGGVRKKNERIGYSPKRTGLDSEAQFSAHFMRDRKIVMR